MLRVLGTRTRGTGSYWPVAIRWTVSDFSPPLLLPLRLRVLRPFWLCWRHLPPSWLCLLPPLQQLPQTRLWLSPLCSDVPVTLQLVRRPLPVVSRTQCHHGPYRPLLTWVLVYCVVLYCTSATVMRCFAFATKVRCASMSMSRRLLSAAQ